MRPWHRDDDAGAWLIIRLRHESTCTARGRYRDGMRAASLATRAGAALQNSLVCTPQLRTAQNPKAIPNQRLRACYLRPLPLLSHILVHEPAGTGQDADGAQLAGAGDLRAPDRQGTAHGGAL